MHYVSKIHGKSKDIRVKYSHSIFAWNQNGFSWRIGVKQSLELRNFWCIENHVAWGRKNLKKSVQNPHKIHKKSA